LPNGSNPTDGFTVTASDEIGRASLGKEGNLTGANDTPKTTAVTISLTDTAAANDFANQAGTLSATDAEGTSLSFGISGGTAGSYSVDSVSYDVSKVGGYGTLYVDSATGKYVYVPNDAAINALPNGSNPTDGFTVTASD